MFEYDFMRYAFAAAGIVAVVSGSVGFFLALRQQTFAGHALSHVGFTGAAAATLIGIAPLWGLIGFTLITGLAMGALGEKLSGRDVAVGVVLSLSLGAGALFMALSTRAVQVTTLLFGNVLGVDAQMLKILALLSLLSLTLFASIVQPLLFCTVQPELAQAKGVPVRCVSMLFLALVALTVASCTQIVGALLVFTLLVGPAAAAQNWTVRWRTGMLLAALYALVCAWGGLALSFFTHWPTSFWISALSALVYGVSLLTGPIGIFRSQNTSD